MELDRASAYLGEHSYSCSGESDVDKGTQSEDTTGPHLEANTGDLFRGRERQELEPT